MWRALLLVVVTACASATRPGIELVETTPIETTLDSELRDAWQVWPEMIAGARGTLDLAEFYVSNQPASRLEPVIAAIEAARARGVRVRMLVDHSFVSVYPETLDRLAKAGATIHHADFSPGILHAKYLVVDDREAYLGSQNLDWRSLEHIVELGARITDPALVGGLHALFEYDWSGAAGGAPPAHGSITLVASPRDRLPAGVPWELPPLLAAIDSARASIHIQALTYRAGDWTELEDALLRAAARGVHVDVLLADWTKRKKTLGGLQALARTPNITIRLVTIPPAASGFIPFARVAHAKLLVVDGTHGWLGTSNFEREYFYASRNVGLMIDDHAIAARLDRFFTTLWTSPYAIRLDPDGSYEPPRIE